MSSTLASSTNKSFLSTSTLKLAILVYGLKAKLRKKNSRKQLKFKVVAAVVRVVINMRN